jgi:hypothetical protein
MRAWVMIFVTWVAIFVGGCAASVPAVAPGHPANSAAPSGRLAPAPASLRPGVVTYPDVPQRGADPEPQPHHHHHGS